MPKCTSGWITMKVSCNLFLVNMGYSFEENVDMLMDAGFSAIDFTVDAKLDYVSQSRIFNSEYKSFAKELCKRAESRGVAFNQSHAPFPSEKFTDFLPRTIEFASLLGIKTIVVHPLHDGFEYAQNKEALFERNMKFYSSLSPYAKSFGIKIGIENMWQRHRITGRICDSVCADPKELCRYYDSLNDPEVFTVCLDTGHTALCGREPEDVIRAVGHDRVGALHLHDVDYIEDLHTVPYLGKINFDRVARALADIGYNGDITLEIKNFAMGMNKSFYPEILLFIRKTAEHIAALTKKYKNENAEEYIL